MSTTIRFDGRVALVTGGGRGLGRAYACEMASRGARIVVADSGADTRGNGLDASPASTVADEIRRSGGEAIACVVDVSTESGGQEAVDAALNHYGRLDVVVASAGTICSAPFVEWSTQDFYLTFRHNTLAAFHVTRPAFEAMKAARYGRMVLVSSAAGVFGQPLLAGYSTAKTSVLGLLNTIALEGAEFGIKANAIMPMGNTRMAVASMGDAADSDHAKAFLSNFRVDQVAPVVAYLASEQCQPTQSVFSAFSGRVAALRIGITPGWFAPTDRALTAEDVELALGDITAEQGTFVPSNIFDEIVYVNDRLASERRPS